MIHYDPHRWLDHFFDLRGSALREVLARVLLCVAWAAVVVGVHVHITPIAIPSTVHALTGFAIGLLLVFRTNASYDRFWEGRKLWGGIVNSSRNLIRAADAYFGDQDPDCLRELARWTAAFPFAAMNALRGVPGLGAVEADLPSLQVAVLRRSQHPALAVAGQMTSLVAQAHANGRISAFHQTALDVFIKELVDHLGGCERIRKTPLPFAYVVHLRRVLVLYCATLPFALVDSYRWLTVLDVLLVSYVFFGIEEIGVEIEGPFGFDANDLPLEDICETIRHNVYAFGKVSPEAAHVAPDPLPDGL